MKSPPPKPQSGQRPKSQAQERPFEFLSPQEKLAKARADANHWSEVAALPGLSPNTAALAFNLARSAKAEAALWEKALLVADAQTVDLMKKRLLDLNSPPQEPQTESNAQTVDLMKKRLLDLNSPPQKPQSSVSPTKPGTSGSTT